MIRDQEILDQLVDLVDRFVRERLIPAEQQVAEDLRIPDDIVQEMKALGLFGMTIPEEYGGLGLTMEEEIHVAMTLGQTSPAFRSILGTNNGIGSAAVVVDGTEDQKQRFLPRYASGELIGCFCLTEPDVGSDAAAVKALHHQWPASRHLQCDGPHQPGDQGSTGHFRVHRREGHAGHHARPDRQEDGAGRFTDL